MNETLHTILMLLTAGGAIASVLAVAIDARRRNRSSIRVGLLCLVTWPVGPILWLMHRPPPPLGTDRSKA